MKVSVFLFLSFLVTTIAAQTVVGNRLQEVLCSFDEYIDVIKLTRGIDSLTSEQQKDISNEYQKQKDYAMLLIAKANKLGVTVTNQEMRMVLEDGTAPILKQSPFINNNTGKFDMKMVNKFLEDYNKKKDTSEGQSYRRIYNYWSYIGKSVRQMKLKEKVIDRNKKNGEQFLINNINKPNIIKLPSGVQYKIIKKGNGEIPQENSVVKLNYEEKTLDGDVISSTYSSGGPLEVQTLYQYQGRKETITHMPVGSTWEVYIPQQLAYGAKGLWPYSLIVMKIELISIIDNDFN